MTLACSNLKVLVDEDRIWELARVDEDASAETLHDVAWSHMALGDGTLRIGASSSAHRLYSRVMAVFLQLGGREPETTLYQRDLSVSYDRLGGLAVANGRVDEAQRLFEDGLAITRALAEKEPENIRNQEFLSAFLARLSK